MQICDTTVSLGSVLSGLRSRALACGELKRDSRRVSRDLGRYSGEWAHWLRKQLLRKQVLVS